MGKSSKAPAAPDPKATSEAQTASNKETAQYNAALNMIDQYTPYGSLTYQQVAGQPQYDTAGYEKALGAWNSGGGAGASAQLTNEQINQRLLDQGLHPGSSDFSRAAYNLKSGQTGGQSGNKSAMPTLEMFRLGGGDLPHYSSTINLTPDGQKLLDSQNRQTGAVNGIAEGYLSRIGDTLNAPIDDGVTTRNSVQQALMSRINPELDRQESQLRTRLANQGILPGSQAYQNEIGQFGQQRNDASNLAILNAGNEQSRAVQLALALRQTPLNEYNALRSASQIQTPQFNSLGTGAQSAGTDISGNIYKSYQGQLNNYNQGVASQNSLTSGLFSLGGSLGAAALMSDMRMKRDIVRLGETPGGLGVYRYRYRKGLDSGSLHYGVMAQEVEKTLPHAVITGADGFKRVDYSQIH